MCQNNPTMNETFSRAAMLLLTVAVSCRPVHADDTNATLRYGHDVALPAPKSLVFSITPDRIIADAEAWKTIGADGFFLEGVASEWSSDIWATDGKPFTIGESDETFQKVRRANEVCAKLGMANFLKVAFANPFEWFNDTAWQHIEHNFRQFAIFARDSGCRGVALDIEYIGQQYVFDWPGYDYKGYTREDLIRKIRERATGVMRAIYDEFPGMEFLVLDRDIVTVTLPKGRTPVLAKATTGVGAWALALRFTDTSGNPIGSLSFSATP